MGIFLALLLIIVVLLNISVRAYVKIDKTRLQVTVKYLWIKLYELDTADGGQDGEENSRENKPEDGSQKNDPASCGPGGLDNKSAGERPSKAEAGSRKPHEKENGESCEAESVSFGARKKKREREKRPDKPSLLDRFNAIKPYIPVAAKGLRKLLKLIRLTRLELVMTVGGSDAYEAGMNFGRANQIFYPALGVICTLFTVTIKKTQILCDFDKSCLDISGSTVAKVTPAAVIGLAIYLLRNYFKIKKLESKREKNNERKEQLS